MTCWRSVLLGVVLVAACRSSDSGLPPGPSSELPDAGRDAIAPMCPGPGCDAGRPPPTGDPCPEGQHSCEGVCVRDDSPATCNRACLPCPAPIGGEATCDGTRCDVVCPEGQKPCADRCIPIASPCDDRCPAGQQLCGQLCVAPTSLTACGAACAICPTTPHGQTTCDGTSCQLTCDAGYQLCGTTCALIDDPGACGPSCTACVAPEGATPTCKEGRCGFTCATGRPCLGQCISSDRACDGTCPAGHSLCNDGCVPTASIGKEICDGKDNDCNGMVDDGVPARACTPACAGNERCVAGKWDTSSCAKTATDPKRCGPTCMNCPAPPGGGASCVGGQCRGTCPGPLHLCPDGCQPNDVNHCGPNCLKCPGPVGGNGAAACMGNQCRITCVAPYKPIGDRCGCMRDTDCPANNVCQPNNTCRFQAPVIRVVSGHYGRVACAGKGFPANPPGTTFDRTAHLARTCNGMPACAYLINHLVIGDPFVGCAKEYRAVWECVSGATVTRRMADAVAEASGKTIALSCM